MTTNQTTFEAVESKNQPGWYVLFYPSDGLPYKIGPTFLSEEEAQDWIVQQAAEVLKVLEGPDPR